jgi:hypothetical protein
MTFNRIDFFGDVTTYDRMLQWTGRNVGGDTLPEGSTHDYLILFDGDSNVVQEEKITRQGELPPGDIYESFTWVQQPDGSYSGYLTLDRDGDESTIGARQREVRFHVTDGQLVVI